MVQHVYNIDHLVDALEPVRPLKTWHALCYTLTTATVVTLVVNYVFGLRTDLAAGVVHPIVLLRGGALLMLGLSTILAAITSGQPAVGRANGESGWRWTLATAALFPISAALLFIAGAPVTLVDLHATLGMYCLATSGAAAALIGTALTLWLRQSAPTSPTQAGWLTGLAAGSLGTFAFSLHCPETGIYYIGFWYSLTVALSALLGRLIVPRFVRW
jgi:hypothetical protein